MLRVLTLSTLFPNGLEPGLGVFVETQTLRLAARADVDLRIVSPLPSPIFPLGHHPRYRRQRSLPREESWKGVDLFRPRFTMLPGMSGTLNPASIDRAVRPILARLRASGFAFDVIDAEFFYPDGPAAARLASAFDVPFSIKARGADIHYWGDRPACRKLILDAADRAGGLLAVAESLKTDMTSLGIDPAKITVHYTGVDLDRFKLMDRAAGKAALGIGGPLVVSLGSLIPRKGHDVTIEAMAMVPGATLLVIGGGPERETLLQLAASRGLGDRVRLLGNLPQAEIPPILAAADVMALASQSEGLANAWIEAMACGTPVVATKVDGAAEAIASPASGRLVTERTPSAMAAAINAILADPPAQDAVRRSAGRFTWSRNAETLYDHLSGLVAAYRPRARQGARSGISHFPFRARSLEGQSPIAAMADNHRRARLSTMASTDTSAVPLFDEAPHAFR